jgi:hypothetical protein
MAICIAYLAVNPGISIWPFCNAEKMLQSIQKGNFTRGLARELRESKMPQEVIEDGLDWALYLLVRAGEWAYIIGRHYLDYHECANDEFWCEVEIEMYFDTLLIDWPKLSAIFYKEPVLYGAIVDETVRQLKFRFPSKFPYCTSERRANRCVDCPLI